MGIEPGKELIWKYIRNECSESEKAFVKSLLENDPVAKAQYERLLQYQEFLNSSEERQNTDFGQKDLKKDLEFNPYYLAAGILLIVIVLLAIYSFLKKA